MSAGIVEGMAILVPAAPAACPVCREDVAWRYVRFGRTFVCPSCLARLTVRGAYRRTIAFAAIMIAFLLAYAAGLRGWWLLVVGYVAVIPVQTVVLLITLRLFSAQFEPTGDVRDILYDTNGHSIVETTAAADLAQPTPAHVRLGQLFMDINQPPTVEGYALQAGIVAMTIGLVWMLSVLLLRSISPDFDARRSGPTGFPVSVTIGRASLVFTNGSDVRWRCRAELGSERLFGAFSLEAGTTTPIAFTVFDPPGGLDDARIRRAAQDRIRLVCDEPSGISHSANLR